ncbi:MAG: hypothetical protein AMXMBFR4_14250 [Candidatus Hydrogenedentota bacterium]
MNPSQVIDRVSVQHSADRGLYVASLNRSGCDEYFVSAPLLDDEQPGALFERAAGAVRDRCAAIVSMEVFGIPHGDGTGKEFLVGAFGRVAWPLTWIDGNPDRPRGGVQIWAATGVALTRITRGRTVVGIRFEDSWATFCRAASLIPANVKGTPEDQATALLRTMEATAQDAGMDFADVVRTWFYNRDITGWYADFNRARDRFFASRGVCRQIVPASTGVGGDNVPGAALSGGFLAVRPKDERVCIAAACSPLQCPATQYGSTFSRAVEVTFPDHARLFVSGTASISRHGQTQYAGDFKAQMDRTLDVVGALLDSRGYTWESVASGVAYVKRSEDVPAARMHLARNSLDALPILVVRADICRDDLLFELEVIALRARTEHSGVAAKTPSGDIA